MSTFFGHSGKGSIPLGAQGAQFGSGFLTQRVWSAFSAFHRIGAHSSIFQPLNQVIHWSD
jgi:hypothetical protein